LRVGLILEKQEMPKIWCIQPITDATSSQVAIVESLCYCIKMYNNRVVFNGIMFMLSFMKIRCFVQK
jgi:hypothetical protein